MRKLGITLVVVPIALLLSHYGVAFLAAERCVKSELVYDYLQGICFRHDEYLPYTTYSSAYGWLIWIAVVSITVGLAMLTHPLWRSRPLLNHARRIVRKHDLLWGELIASILLFLFGAFFVLIGIGGSGVDSLGNAYASPLGVAIAGGIFVALGVWLFCQVILEWRRRRKSK